MGGMKGDSDPKGRILGWAHVVDCGTVQNTRDPDDGGGLLQEILGTELYPQTRVSHPPSPAHFGAMGKQEQRGTLGS